uniref:ATPase subunit 8 n=1 Tax=Hypsiscopus plumbea TaxID=1938377 RepID=A9X4G9_HYPPM|nr:ATP synthase F0 subunit 8 [Hypsiscopus plumbea]UTI44795.1 ATPase subunit 8 [Hypsiscopus murphyi]ABC55934.1 ATPase subunit 8 [Hypsiscopus plumbea]UTI44797.1 ATPase subunit 8 [Hypsiscopus murphyi]UTI44799.1 ATPase subunit 8 [Hypsiscopus murphyi]UTI44801.1 ATPase subunit 8 [Hypsiscopus murphyi]
MPQLDTIHIFSTFLWTWFTLHLLIKKTSTFKIISTPKKPNMMKTDLKNNLPWT